VHFRRTLARRVAEERAAPGDRKLSAV